MTVSGGEPAMQPDGVIALIEAVREKGITSAMETCGIGSADFYRRAHELGCLFLFDIKEVDSEKHRNLPESARRKFTEILRCSWNSAPI